MILSGNMYIHNCLKFIVAMPWVTWVIYMLVTALFYMQASIFPLFSPVVVQPWIIDEHMPFLPSLAYIYITYFLLFPVLILLAHKHEGFGIVYATGLVSGLVTVAIYVLFPTMLATRTAAPEATLLSVIQAQDTTLCAFPSGHVALPVSLAVAAYITVRKTESAITGFWGKVSFGYVMWAAAIAIAALFTGQHYMIDICAGVIFGICVAYFVYMMSRVYRRTFVALLTEWLIIIIVVATALYVNTAIAYTIAGFIISTRQHALLMLFHDGVHGLVASDRRLNDFIINAMTGVPLLIPVHVYRAIHISHHKHVGTPKDPERLLLYWGQPWNYKPMKSSALLLQFLGDVSGFNSLVMMARYMMMRLGDNEFDLTSTRAYSDLMLIFAAFATGVAVSLYMWPGETVAVLLLWFIPYLTFTQFLQKVRSFAEHSLDEKDNYTYSWDPGLFGRLTIWPYNINYHREHHVSPSVSWDLLPSYADTGSVRSGRELIAHIWTGSSK